MCQVGWGQRKLVRLMQEDWPGHEVHLTVKKQPCHGVLNTATGFFKPIRLPSLIGTPPLLTGSGTEQRTHTIEPICPSVPPPPKPKEEKEKGGGGGRKSQAEVEEDLEGAQPVAQRASLFRRATVIGLQAKGNEESGSQEAKDSVVEGKGHDAVVDRTVSSPPGKSSAPSKTPTHRLRREEDGKRGGISKELAAISPMKEREKERGSEMQLPASDHIEVKKIVRENVRTYRRPLVRNPALQSQLTVDSLKSSSLYQPPPPPLSKPMAPAFVMNLDTPHASDTGEVARGGDGPQMIVKEDSVTVDGVEYPPVFIPETYSLQRARPPGAGGSLRRHHKPLGPSMPDS
ncbi:unnamed protein product [Darwinula stevensoni]|uniref:Uncharacterized protein n=1 Tax=Darwinula stevensoni TaxID=69355 RepID=A0A7R8ZX25_9CRUS|nr:unnamed protein product [Darwinula stevensoni]CAG0878596.1 unnamed protein product [Darwinula stevensoni]